MFNTKNFYWLTVFLLAVIFAEFLSPQIELVAAQTATPLPPSPTPTPIANISVPDAGPVLSIQSTPDPLIASRTAEFEWALRGQREPDARCYGIPVRPLDLIFVIDNSASAGSGEAGSNLDGTRQILQGFVTQSDQDIYVGIEVSAQGVISTSRRTSIGFLSTRVVDSNTEIVRETLSQDYQRVREVIDGLSSGGDTDTAEAIREATLRLQQRARPEARQVLVLMLHDRLPINDATVAAVEEARRTGIDVYLFSNPINIPPAETIDGAIALRLVDEEHFFSAPTPEQLRRAFVQMSGGSSEWVAREILVVAIWYPFGLEALDLTADSLAAQDTVLWRVEQLADQEEAILRYAARVGPQLAEEGIVHANIVITYLDCNGYWKSQVQSLSFLVREENAPTPSPLPPTPPPLSPSPEPLPSSTPGMATPRPTRTDFPITISPPVTVTPPPLQYPWQLISWLSFLEPLIGSLPVIIEWILIVIVVILLVAALIFLIWKLIEWLTKRKRRPDKGNGGIKPPPLPLPPPTPEIVPQWIKDLTADKKIFK